MGFKEVTGARQYRAWKDWEKGDFIVGTYVDSGTQDTDYGEQCWYDVEVTESNFNVEENRIFRLNGSGSVDNKMDMIAHGSKIKVIYDGVGTMNKGKFKGKDFHDVRILVAEEDAKAKKEEQVEEEVDLSNL